MMTISSVMLVLALSCSAFAAPSAPMTCSEAAMKNLGLKTKAADILCNSCSTGVVPCPTCSRCKSCIKAAGTYAAAQACLPMKSPKPLSPPAKLSPPPKARNPAPPAGTPVPLTCSGAVQQSLGVSKATADSLCLACPSHNQSECKACVKAATTKAEAKACPATTA